MIAKYTTKDIYLEVNMDLLNQDFMDKSFDEQIEILDRSLKKYIIKKIKSINNKTLEDNNNELPVNECLSILKEIIPIDYQDENLSNFSFYILGLVETFQNNCVIWEIEEDPSLIDNPLIEFNEIGNWNKLITHKQTDAIKVFNHTYDIFKKSILKSEKNSKKQNFKKILKILDLFSMIC